jgi:large subunit ribosomal protein L29
MFMKVSDIRQFSTEELDAKEAELRQECFNLRCQKQTQQIENTAALAKVRRDIARVKTVLAEKQRAGA